MNAFVREFAVAAPPDRVWTIMRDVERWSEWTRSVTSIRVVGGGELRVGARAWVRQPKFPPALWVATEFDDARRSFTWVNRAPGLLVTAQHSVAPSGAGSRARLSLRYDGLFGPLLARMTRGITERYLDMEAVGLTACSEAAR